RLGWGNWDGTAASGFAALVMQSSRAGRNGRPDFHGIVAWLPFPGYRLVPRTRSSHHYCRESDCELRVQSGTRIIELLVSFDSEVRYGACGIFGRTSESGH